MKRKKITALTLMTAGLAVSSVLGGMAISKNVTASAATYSVASSAVFMAAGDATLNTTDVKVDGEDKKVVTLSMPDGSNAFFKRNLAYEWYEGKGDKKKGSEEGFFAKKAKKLAEKEANRAKSQKK